MTRTGPAAIVARTLAALAACAPAAQPSPVSGLQPAGRAGISTPPYTAADVHFMAGMIRHHAQAVLMAGWAPSHGASAAVRVLCERIVVAQRDEVAFMERWLRERHEPVPDAGPLGAAADHTMPGMEHAMLMPGMLTPGQLAQLDGARGPEFDRLFLQFMIRHHQGAITMVQQLFNTQGAAQDGLVFKFAADVNVDQTTEIDRMNQMLAAVRGSSQ